MKIGPHHIFYAVLTGDVVHSSRMSEAQRRQLKASLKATFQRVQEYYPEKCPIPGAVFRGDSWQFLVSVPMDSVRIALLIRTLLRYQFDFEIDSRVSIGIGQVDFIPKESIADGDGPAFHLSGRGLDKMSRNARMALDIQHVNIQLLKTVVNLIDVISSDWTVAQCQAVVSTMLGWNQEETALDWDPEPITQQAVAQHLRRAKWSAVSSAIEDSMWGLTTSVSQLQSLVD